MKLYFCVGRYQNWDSLKRKMILYNDYPGTELPQIGDRVIPNAELEAEMKRMQAWDKCGRPYDYVVGRVITPLGLVFILERDPSLIKVIVRLESDQWTYYKTVLEFIPRKGDILPMNGKDMYVTAVKIVEPDVIVLVSEKRTDQATTAPAMTSPLTVKVDGPVEVWSDRPLDVNFTGQDVHMDVEVNDVSTRHPIDVNIAGQDDNIDVRIYKYD